MVKVITKHQNYAKIKEENRNGKKENRARVIKKDIQNEIFRGRIKTQETERVREKRKRNEKKRCYRKEGGERSMKNMGKNMQKMQSKN